MDIDIFIPIEPKSVQAGAKFASGRAYSDISKRAYLTEIATRVKVWMFEQGDIDAFPIKGPIIASYSFRFPFLKKDSLRSSGMRKVTRPDLTNLIKPVEDAIQSKKMFKQAGMDVMGAGLIGDDCQIAAYFSCEKVFHKEPGIRIKLIETEKEI